MKKCPICNSKKITKRVTTEIFEYKNNEIKIPNYVSFECLNCGEETVSSGTLKKSEKILKNFMNIVNSRL